MRSRCALCVFYLFVQLRLGPCHIRAGIKISAGYRSLGKIRAASRRCTAVPVAPPGGEKITDSRFSRFFVSFVPLFRLLMLTPMLYCPGRVLNSRPHAHRNFKHDQGVPHP